MRLSLRLIAGFALVAVAAACTDTRSIDAPIPPGKVAGRISLNPEFSASARTVAASLADFGITFDRVRVAIRNPDDLTLVVLDTTVAFGPSSSDLVLDLTVPVDRAGQLFNALVQYSGQSGVVYSGTVLVQAYAPDQPPPQTPALVLQFVGPGATLKTIALSPKPVTLVASQTIPLTITATDSSGASIATPPLLFASSDESVAKVVVTGTTASIQSFGKRGQARIVATTPIGISDTLSAIVTLPATTIAVVSGAGQTATVGAQLAQPIIVQVSASDGVGVAGVTVTFTPTTGATVGTSTAVTDANGRASTTLTLSTVADTQAVTISSGSLATARAPAIAKPGPPSTATSTIGASDSTINADDERSVVVSMVTRDEFGNRITTGGATVTLTTNLGHWGTNAAATTTATDNGDGTYSATLRSSRSGTVTIAGTVNGFAVTTPPVSIRAIATVLDHFDVTLADGSAITGARSAGVSTAVRITARDLSNNTVEGFTGQPVVSITNSTLVGGNPNLVAPNAIAGVSTTSVKFGRPATNVTLDATSATKTGHSAVFSVVTGPPSLITPRAITLVYPMGQTPASYPILDVTDGGGNPTPNQTVAFTVTGPCSLARAQLTANTQAAIAFDASTLTIPLGGADFPFSCQLTGSAVQFNAPPAQVALLVQPSGATVWTARTDDAWETLDNWTVGVPSSSTGAFIAAAQPRTAPFIPVIRGANPTIPSIDVEDGAQLNLNGHTLAVRQNIDARATGVINGGTITVPAGANGGFMRGTLPTVACQSGAYTLIGDASVFGTMTLGNCSLDLAGHALKVTQSLAVGANAALNMSSGANLTVSGNASFGGLPGNITGGTLTVVGDFTQSGTGSFAPSGDHTVVLSSDGATHNVTFADVTGARFQRLKLVFTSGRTVNINSAVQIPGGLTISGSGGTLSLPVGLANPLNAPIVIEGTTTINVAGAVAPNALDVRGGSTLLQGTGTLDLGGATVTLGAGVRITLDATGPFIAPSSGRCTRAAGVTIDGRNAAAVAALSNACPAPAP